MPRDYRALWERLEMVWPRRLWGSLQTARLFKGLAEEELNLTVHAAQVIIRPALQGQERPLIEPEEEGLSFGHELSLSGAV